MKVGPLPPLRDASFGHACMTPLTSPRFSTLLHASPRHAAPRRARGATGKPACNAKRSSRYHAVDRRGGRASTKAHERSVNHASSIGPRSGGTSARSRMSSKRGRARRREDGMTRRVLWHRRGTGARRTYRFGEILRHAQADDDNPHHDSPTTGAGREPSSRRRFVRPDRSASSGRTRASRSRDRARHEEEVAGLPALSSNDASAGPGEFPRAR